MTSLPDDQDVGRAWTAYIVGELFEAWPRRCDFSALDLGRATGVSPRKDEEELFDDLSKWLLDNGFIHFDQATEGAAFGVALTEKGFAVLGRNAPGTEKPLGTKLKEAGRRSWERRGAGNSRCADRRDGHRRCRGNQVLESGTVNRKDRSND
ncbi:hypothetical protein ACVWZ6_005603 [Bradyrhizobium sp. GM6.1]